MVKERILFSEVAVVHVHTKTCNIGQMPGIRCLADLRNGQCRRFHFGLRLADEGAPIQHSAFLVPGGNPATDAWLSSDPTGKARSPWLHQQQNFPLFGLCV